MQMYFKDRTGSGVRDNGAEAYELSQGGEAVENRIHDQWLRMMEEIYCPTTPSPFITFTSNYLISASLLIDYTSASTRIQLQSINLQAEAYAPAPSQAFTLYLTVKTPQPYNLTVPIPRATYPISAPLRHRMWVR